MSLINRKTYIGNEIGADKKLTAYDCFKAFEEVKMALDSKMPATYKVSILAFSSKKALSDSHVRLFHFYQELHDH